MAKKQEEENPYALGKLEGVGPTRSKRLEESGVKLIHDLCLRSPQEIARITGLDNEDAEKLCSKAKIKLEEMGVIRPTEQKAPDAIAWNEKLPIIHSGCEAMDKLFGGGIRGETLTELYGEFGTGKTQFLFTMVVQALKEEKNIIFLDCEGTFDYNRLIDVALTKKYYTDKEEALTAIGEHLTVILARDSNEVVQKLNNVTTRLVEDNIELLVVDGSVGAFRSDYAGRDELSARQIALKPLMNRLKAIATYFPTVVIFTNQVLENAGQFFGDPTKPVGGHIVGHAATYRVYLRKSGSKYLARMIDSPHHPKQDIEYNLTAAGVVDVEKKEKKKVEEE